jgi:hypothetical protein
VAALAAVVLAVFQVEEAASAAEELPEAGKIQFYSGNSLCCCLFLL